MTLAVAGLTPAAASAAPDDHTTTGGFRPEPVDWQPCPESPGDPAVRCGALTLPIDWSDPGGPTFSLAVARRAATDPAARRGPLVINPGGPGGSGVDFTLEAQGHLSPGILKSFDIIGFDPRGVRRSNPVQCSAELAAQQPFLVPDTEAEYAALLSFNARFGADCRARTGPLFDHVDTLSVDRDIDAIRAALGERQISYFGISYGTLIGQEYAELFPDRIRAMVVDSNMDHSLGTEPFLLTEAATDEDSFREFIAWCDRDTSCALHGQDVAAVWTDLMRRADAGTLTVPGSSTKPTWWDLTRSAISVLYGPNWSTLANEIALLSTGGSASSLTAVGQAVFSGGPAHRFQPGGGPQAPAELVPNPLAIFCEDWSLPVSGFGQLKRYFDESRGVAPLLRTSTLGWSASVSCLGWPAKVNNPQHPLRVRAGIPLLVLNAVHDPATPYAWALDAAFQLGSHGRLVTYQGWGHGAYGHSDCTAGTVDEYLIDRTLPAFGATCPAVPPQDPAFRTLAVPVPAPGSLGWTY
ncbi:MAG TPA: alpha/beta hydrolase [Amycolatopsis sp.]|uniref:alpha/beta hydrolase n=1 Tax=Amycolatopsis sp. TaxID=37632 RepID=UPI002B47A64A|nr:alpha/beta hydrolase [Amycolatopsis sp.]HKS49603.1 alpha/beta hydrolase [Amycolatopsis sp.]